MSRQTPRLAARRSAGLTEVGAMCERELNQSKRGLKALLTPADA
jgi:hypothetical protein